MTEVCFICRLTPQMAAAVGVDHSPKLKPGACNSNQVSYMHNTGPSAWAIIRCCPRCIYRELKQKQTARTSSRMAGLKASA